MSEEAKTRRLVMKLDGHPAHFTVVSGTFVLPASPAAPPACKDACREPPVAEPSAADLAKQPGLLGRLDAMLNV